ncbi:MAG: reductive dehalogenase [Dehalogenimonas sp.]
MTNIHNTISRRDFMKSISFTGGGLGTAAIAFPVFHDLDELANSPSGAEDKQPWWVKELEYMDSVTPVEWDQMQRFANYDNEGAHLTPEHKEQRAAKGYQIAKDRILNGTPGETLRDRALALSNITPVGQGLIKMATLGIDDRFLEADGIQAMNMTSGLCTMNPNVGIPQGVPSWEGSPEENSRMLRSACRNFGSQAVTTGELNDNTQKLVYKENSLAAGVLGGKVGDVVFEDVDEPYEVPRVKRVIPTKFKYVVVAVIGMNTYQLRLAPTSLSSGGVYKAYHQNDISSARIVRFIRALGWGAVGSIGIFGMEANGAFGELFGLGETGRIHQLITPEWGPLIRKCCVVYTDMPLSVANPIDFGASRFCKTCTKCADVCPGKAIQFGDRTWDITPTTMDAGKPDHLDPSRFNAPGKKIWWLNHFACHNYWVENATNCSICSSECVFTKQRLSTIHEAVKPIISSTSLFNGFFTRMDRAFGYGNMGGSVYEDWWNNPRPIEGENF